MGRKSTPPPFIKATDPGCRNLDNQVFGWACLHGMIRFFPTRICKNCLSLMMGWGSPQVFFHLSKFARGGGHARRRNRDIDSRAPLIKHYYHYFKESQPDSSLVEFALGLYTCACEWRNREPKDPSIAGPFSLLSIHPLPESHQVQ